MSRNLKSRDGTLNLEGTVTFSSSLLSGLTGAQATELGLKQYNTTATSGGANDLYIGGVNTVYGAYFIPYKMTTGEWHLRFGIDFQDTTTSSSQTLTINGILTPTNKGQPCSASLGNTAISSAAYIGANTKTVYMWATVAGQYWQVSGDIELASKPLWAD